MRTDYESEDYLRGCIKSCQEKGHIQQVCFSTYHNAITQVCFTCEAVRTSISHEEVKGSKKAKPLSHFALDKQKGTNGGNDGIK